MLDRRTLLKSLVLPLAASSVAKANKTEITEFQWAYTLKNLSEDSRNGTTVPAITAFASGPPHTWFVTPIRDDIPVLVIFGSLSIAIPFNQSLNSREAVVIRPSFEHCAYVINGNAVSHVRRDQPELSVGRYYWPLQNWPGISHATDSRKLMCPLEFFYRTSTIVAFGKLPKMPS